MVFSGSLHLFAWQSTNCHECKKYGEDAYSCTCELAEKLDLACLGNKEPEPDYFEPWGFVGGKIPEQCSQKEPARPQ